MSGTEVSSSNDDMSFAKANRKMLLATTGTNINAATKQGPGQMAYTEDTSSGFAIDNYYNTDRTNSFWTNNLSGNIFRTKWGSYQSCSSTFSNNIDGILKVASLRGSLSLDSYSSVEGRANTFTTGSGAGDDAGFNLGSIYCSAFWGPTIKIRFKFNETSNIRVFMGWLNSESIVGNTDDMLSGLQAYGLGKQTTSSNFRIIHNDGTGSTVSDDTGFAVDTNWHDLILQVRSVGGNPTFYAVIDDILENTSTTEIPSDNTGLSMQAIYITTTAAVRAFKMNHVFICSDK